MCSFLGALVEVDAYRVSSQFMVLDIRVSCENCHQT